ncbi:AAA family ATPase (plasmid) [Skermanella mucosa]|uniref:AAA family ATPase n=1 Tax=Skermanella mucosa TaxID=1789672 RepID=UPI00192BD003|nr:AAA family ATPase [Skermanella mucosa]UEM25378.1 AAA family ATPase [Skermanella mucosa]
MIGPELKTLREGRGMDQRTFAEHLNGQLGRSYDKARISRWESGAERIPSQVAKFVAAEMAPKTLRPRRSVVVAVANQKGGVGKTSSAVNLAFLLATAGLRTVLVDSDPQASATAHLGIDQAEAHAAGKTLYPVLRQEKPIGDVIVPVCEGLFDLVPSTIALANVDIELASDPVNGGPLAMRDRLSPLRETYDAILIDCGPTLSMLTVNALNAADQLLVPVQTETLAGLGVSMLLETANKLRRRSNPDLQILGILPTMYTPRNAAEKMTLDELHELFGHVIRIFDPIPRTTKFTQSARAQLPLLKAAPNAPGAEVYHEIARTLINYVTAEDGHVAA